MVKASDKIREWRNDAVLFVREVFRVEPDLWQITALTALCSKDINKQRIAMRSCTGPGKSTILAWSGWWFLVTQGGKGDHPKGIAISVTWDNLKDGLASEMSKWQCYSKFLMSNFTWTKTRIYANDFPETWFISFRSFNKSANPEEQGRVLSGIHSGHVLFLVDEAGEIPPTVLKAAEQAMSAEHFAKILVAGNPTSNTGILYEVNTRLADAWMNIAITSDPDDPNRTPRVSKEWAAKQIATYGRTDPWVMSSILGEFPESSINTLLSLSEVEEAMGKHHTLDMYDYSQRRLGIDVARFGADSTIIFPRQGLAAFDYVEMRGARSNDIAARVAKIKGQWESEMEFVDATGGFGSGVSDSLIQAGFSPYDVHFSGKATDPKFYNRRAEMFYNMAEWIKRGGSIPNCTTLKKELLAPTYTFKNGRLIIEDKEQIKKRLGYSTDRSDALALTFAIEDMPSSLGLRGLTNKTNKVLTDSNPFDKM